MSPKISFVRNELGNGSPQHLRGSRKMVPQFVLNQLSLEIVAVIQKSLPERLPAEAALQAFKQVQNPAAVRWLGLTRIIERCIQKHAELQLQPGEIALAGNLYARPGDLACFRRIPVIQRLPAE